MRLGGSIMIAGAAVAVAAAVVVRLTAPHGPPAGAPIAQQAADMPSAAPSGSAPDSALASITIDYPEDGSIFPPDITAPTFLWHDAAETAAVWHIDVTRADGTAGIHAESRGEPPGIGVIDERCISKTNETPKLTPREATARSWTPDAETWEAVKKQSAAGPATVIISGLRDRGARGPVSSGRVTIRTSKDPVGAPIFYRDVPLMPSELQPGVIKPLSESAQALVAWRLRNVAQPSSRLLLEKLATCANCHSFSRDGKTLGMDLDGPQNDKGLYTVVPLAPHTSIGNQDVISWNAFSDKPLGQKRVGFLSQLSPDGQFVVTTLNEEVYVVNFKDYRFLQVFYPTRGILAWYSRAERRSRPLPGADDPYYVHTDAVWTPDGKYLVFARAEAKDAYPKGRKLAERANDPNEVPIQYDLYRIPFNAGRGGRPEPVPGAAQNGMSNTFPKVSPDGRWIVFVQCRNGQLMRPDSQLFIVPAQGGQARRMRCNTPLMNSWHSFSPNGRWLVFSSKSRSPYTQMYLTHLDEEGGDSPAIRIDNATAANRAVNIPEFVNIPPEGLLKIDVPAAEVYRLFNLGVELGDKGQYGPAVASFRKALEIDPEFTKAHKYLGVALGHQGKVNEAVTHLRKALEFKPEYVEAHYELGMLLMNQGRITEAIAQFQAALELRPGYADAHHGLGVALGLTGRLDQAAAHLEKSLELAPESAVAHKNLASVLVRQGRVDEAIAHLQKALEVNPKYAAAHSSLGAARRQQGRLDDAMACFQAALKIDPNSAEAHNGVGDVLAQRGRPDEAILHFEKALEANPGSADAHYNLGATLGQQGKIDEAIKHFRKAIELHPDDVMARYNLGACLQMQGKHSEAVAQWREALRLAPNHVPSLYQAAWVLATSPEAATRDGAEALMLAQRAVEFAGDKDPLLLDALAAAYAEVGRFPDAAQTAERALTLASSRGNGPLGDALRARIKLYQAGSAFHEKSPLPATTPSKP